jgi:protein SCO1/2
LRSAGKEAAVLGGRATIVLGLGLAMLGSGAAPAGRSRLADIGPAPAVVLTDAAGKPFDLARLRGKAVVVSFVYTTCTGTCPATTYTLVRVRQALEQAGLWGTHVEFVAITLDPAHDRPEVLAAYARSFGADAAAWHFLTGPPDAVARVIAAWDMWVKPGPSGTLDHPSRIFLLDPRGHQREIYSLEFLRPAAVVEDVASVLAEPAGGPPVPEPGGPGGRRRP